METFFAALTLLLSTMLLLRLVLGARRRAKLDRLLARLWQRARLAAVALWRWPRKRRQARQLAEDAIRRASQGKWDGNVYTPEQFKKPPRDKMH